MSHMIITVDGPIRPDTVGICSVGEHLVARFFTERPRLATDTWFYEQSVRIELLGDLMLGRANRDDAEIEAEHALTDLANFALKGGGTVVEVTATRSGRDPEQLQRLARESGVNVVMATGAMDNPADIVAELIYGVEGVRAGLISICAGSDSVPAIEAAFYAARKTGAPVRVDMAARPGEARTIIDTARWIGVDPARVAMAGVTALVHEPDCLRHLLASGVHIVFDRLGRIPTIRTRTADHDVGVVIAGLVADHADRILLGCSIDRKHAMNAFGGNGLRFIPGQFLPYLAHLGVGPDMALRLVKDNPARFLTWAETSA